MNDHVGAYIAREHVLMETWEGDDADARREAGEPPDKVLEIDTEYAPDGSVIKQERTNGPTESRS